jgi:hypothetical protein
MFTYAQILGCNLVLTAKKLLVSAGEVGLTLKVIGILKTT